MRRTQYRDSNGWHVIAVAAACLVSACSLTEMEAERPPRSGGPTTADVRELARLVNDHRGTVGCPPLRWDADLAAVAAAHSRDMEQRAYLGHTSPDGEGVVDRVRNAGLRWRTSIAENLAQTTAGPSDAVLLWIRSPPHRANLENCNFRVQGAGRAGDMWTQILAGAIESS